MSGGWSWYVIALIAVNIAGCVWLLWWTSRRRPGDPKPEDTSHVWDGDLTEYNKPLPRWWINLFYLTIVFAIGYLVWYPGFGNFAGYGKWTSRVEHDRDAAKATATLEKTFAPYQGQPIDVLARDPQAVKLGSSIFGISTAVSGRRLSRSRTRASRPRFWSLKSTSVHGAWRVWVALSMSSRAWV